MEPISSAYFAPRRNRHNVWPRSGSDLLVAVAALLLASGCAPDSDPEVTGQGATQTSSPNHATLFQRYEPGNRYIYRFDMSYEMEMDEALGEMMPAGSGMSQTQEFALSALEALPDGEVRLELEFLKVEIDADLPGQKLSFNSADTTEDELSQLPQVRVFQQMVGSKINLVVDANGQRRSVTGLLALRAKATEGIDPQIGELIAGTFTESYVDSIITPMLPPQQAVQPGDSWPSNQNRDMGVMGVAMMDIQSQYKGKVEHQGKDAAHITFSGTITGKTSNDSSTPFSDLMKLTEGKVSGSHWYDFETGQVFDSTVDQTMMMKLEIPGLPAEAMSGGGMGIGFHQKYSRRLLRVETIGDPADEVSTE